jgi:hypothetical protein
VAVGAASVGHSHKAVSDERPKMVAVAEAYGYAGAQGIFRSMGEQTPNRRARGQLNPVEIESPAELPFDHHSGTVAVVR